MKAGGETSAATILWWLKQPEAARARVAEPGKTERQSLLDLNAFLRKAGFGSSGTIWANGAHFDATIIAEAYRRQGLTPLFGFWQVRDYRTQMAAYGAKRKPGEKATHTALEDAKAQALALIEAGVEYNRRRHGA
jgi:hypothetical protein